MLKRIINFLFKPNREYIQHSITIEDSFIAVLDDMNKVMYYINSNNNKVKYSDWADTDKIYNHIKEFKIGVRVKVNDTAGFSRGARGIIEYVEPSGRCWVLRDGADKACYYCPSELDMEE
jgi:hypothetical protein